MEKIKEKADKMPTHTINKVNQLHNNNKGVDSFGLDSYIRVGDKYYKHFYKPTPKGNYVFALQQRSRQSIVDDYGKDALSEIAKFDDFVILPNNLEYKKEIRHCYNLYRPVNIELDTYEESSQGWGTIEALIKHVFGDQYELGLDYLYLLFFQPTQVLPVLCLVSEKQSTGKTTFGKLIRSMIGDNFTSIGSNEFNSEFNASYATKLACMIDESYIPAKSIDKLKMLSTSDTIQLRIMRTDPINIAFFCKFILCSNREDNFIIADKNDIRYWVRKLESIESFDPDFEDKINNETESFIRFLYYRGTYTSKQSRMWFKPADIETEQLNIVRKASLPNDVKQYLSAVNDLISDYIHNPLENYNQETIFYFSSGDLSQLAFENHLKSNITATKFSKVLECNKNEETTLKKRRYNSIIAKKDLNRDCFGVSLKTIKELLG